uniref:RNA-directed DNA polymerase n=1 Tax=Schizaphis graminum TaxID=13262 RepID=A0A2S2P219_SCHGA
MIKSNQKYLKMFDTPLNMGLRFALGAFKSSPIESLRNLANKLPPDLRRTYNTLLYTARSLINIENTSNKYLAKKIKKAEEYHIDLQHLVKTKPPSFSPWKLSFDINLEISELKKENNSSIMYRNIFQNTLQKYPNFKHIYTNASKTDQNVGNL